MDMFWVVPMLLHSPLMNLDANLGSLLLMNFQDSPNHRNICWMISPTVSSAVIASV